MFDRTRLLAASREEVQHLAGQRISEVTPSRRDFAQYVATQKEDLAVIARLSRRSPQQPTAAVIELARACDDAEVAALAVATGTDGLSMDDMAAIAVATTAPILRETLTIDPSQLYYARLHGADAALFPAAELARGTLQELVTIASSLHMASVIEVVSAADVDLALSLPHVVVGIDCRGSEGALDVPRTQQLAQHVPRQHSVIVLPEVRSAEECAALRGLCDAIVVGEALCTAGDVRAALRELMGG